MNLPAVFFIFVIAVLLLTLPGCYGIAEITYCNNRNATCYVPPSCGFVQYSKEYVQNGIGFVIRKQS